MMTGARGRFHGYRQGVPDPDWQAWLAGAREIGECTPPLPSKAKSRTRVVGEYEMYK